SLNKLIKDNKSLYISTQIKKLKNVSKLQKKQQDLLEEIRNIGNLCRRTVVLLKQTCTNKNCSKCKSGEKHPQFYLTQSKNSKSKLTFLGNKNEKSFREWTENHKKIKQLIDDISDVNLILLKLGAFEGAN
ncbi:hypothetical protein KA977_03685, partial [Candidatus Dependentiae bacterium]|nr:hypothetical protein [Candidatus Dependentiae bacterium]